jgi:hypothetical protein
LFTAQVPSFQAAPGEPIQESPDAGLG